MVTSPQRPDWTLYFEINVGKIEKIKRTGILSIEGSRDPFFESVVTQVLVCLNDVLQKLSQANQRITFTDDIPQNGEPGRDVTWLINLCRNCACHIEKDENRVDASLQLFNVVGGGNDQIIVNGARLGCDYLDEIAIYWGRFRLLLNRHMLRAFDEAVQRFSGL